MTYSAIEMIDGLFADGTWIVKEGGPDPDSDGAVLALFYPWRGQEAAKRAAEWFALYLADLAEEGRTP